MIRICHFWRNWRTPCSQADVKLDALLICRLEHNLPIFTRPEPHRFASVAILLPKYQDAPCPVFTACWISHGQSYIRNCLAQLTSTIRRPIVCGHQEFTIAKGPPSPIATSIIRISPISSRTVLGNTTITADVHQATYIAVHGVQTIQYPLVSRRDISSGSRVVTSCRSASLKAKQSNQAQSWT